MNLRILKKLSKRVAPVVAAIVKDQDAFFKADAGDNFTNTGRHDRKHWERTRSVHDDLFFKQDIKTKAFDGNGYICLSRQFIHPWKNTDMIGWMVGYYEPEWEEETVWDYFKGYVFQSFTSYKEIPDTRDEFGTPDIELVLERKLSNPSSYLNAFLELQMKKEQSQ